MKTETAHHNVAAELRQMAAELIQAATVIERVAGASAPPVKVTPRIKSSGTETVVLSAIRDGFDTVKAIALEAKVKEFTARSAILALEKARKVKREGKGMRTRYVVAA